MSAEGGHEVLGVDVSDFEEAVFWTAILTGLKGRGPGAVDFLISDAHRRLQVSVPNTV